MINLLKSFFKEEDGMGTVEIILIIAVLVGIALIFRAKIIEFVTGIIGKIFPNTGALDDNSKVTGQNLFTPKD